ncbi:MAG TPA: Nudix family hydrolase [Burkholderiales bacterium]|nr:Nudix family hydrolase [Burkholderiales bacterium]
MIEVAAAVIQRPDGRFLLAQRPQGKVYAGFWEFPGGKVEPGEPAERALARELHEELGIDVRASYPWITREYIYPHGHVRLNFFRVLEWSGEPHPREDQAIAWQDLGAPMAAPMLPANAPVLASLGLPHEYAITDAARLGIPPMLEALERRLAQGLQLVQIREPHLAEAARELFTTQAIGLAHRYGCKAMVKAPHPGADGMHYTAAELMRLERRAQGGLAAASCHTRAEVERAMALGLDFAVLGPVLEKSGGSPLGWDRFAAIARGSSIPIYAIGGVTPVEMESAWSAGAHGLAMIRGSWR